ncbi:MAG: oxygen-dependent coproporphyrinogen oxidase [Bacteroidetes bacterium]|nr:oxygen-dependent coproporphyrinogen oxidase [Bacteroidota bacterium]
MRALTNDLIVKSFRDLQSFIVAELEKIDGKGQFMSDEWFRKEGGGGRTMIMEQGLKIIKGGVAFSQVEGEITAMMREHMTMKGHSFFATGVSIVLHSAHPFHPTMHMNVRYFETDQGDEWFGGGIDLTPIYIDEGLARSFHGSLKRLCDTFSLDSYARFKDWADDYFYLPHRQETRGVGGIFFDHLKPKDVQDKQRIFDFCMDLGRNFPVLYANQSAMHHDSPTEEQLYWQALRWSRYVEYNLLYDRGTRFGIVSNGRTESILLSMPPIATWKYNYHPDEDSLQFQTLRYLKKGLPWV